MRRMLSAQEDVFYYVTVMNEGYAQPSMPKGAGEGILRGMYRVREAAKPKVRLLGAGTILPEAMAAAELLERDWQVAAEVFSVTSFTELRREAMGTSRSARLGGTAAVPWVARQLPAIGVPVVAASDYVSAVADLIRPWVGDAYTALGTDGFGRSDTRERLRRFFGVDRHAIAVAALHALGDARKAEAMERYGVDSGAPPWRR